MTGDSVETFVPCRTIQNVVHINLYVVSKEKELWMLKLVLLDSLKRIGCMSVTSC